LPSRSQAADLQKIEVPYTLAQFSSGIGRMRWSLDLGGLDQQDAVAAHLGRRGISLEDVFAVAGDCVPRRKGNRILLFGRATDGTPLVVLVARSEGGWRPRTAWVMDERERRWWRARGGR
jgi:hypothetical protein